MVLRLSRRASKYVWMCLPGAFAVVLTGAWFFSIAPESQQASRREAEWRRDLTAQKERAEFLQENRIYSDYRQLTLLQTFADDVDLMSVVSDWASRRGTEVYRDGQTIRLLEENHQCIGFYVAGVGLFFERQNPGLCAAKNADVPAAIQNSQKY